VRLIKSGILLFLILKGTLGFAFGNTSGSGTCCDTANMEVVSSMVSQDMPADVDDSEKGCCDLTCHCLCCIHIMSDVTQDMLVLEAPKVIGQSDAIYSFSYQHVLLKNIWQPPRRI
jgi:hypothetical protein